MLSLNSIAKQLCSGNRICQPDTSQGRGHGRSSWGLGGFVHTNPTVPRGLYSCVRVCVHVYAVMSDSASVCVCVYTHTHSLMSDSSTPWTVACQVPLSMEFSRQEHWRRLPIPSLGDLPDPGIELKFLASLALAGVFFTTSATWEAPPTPYSKSQFNK